MKTLFRLALLASIAFAASLIATDVGPAAAVGAASLGLAAAQYCGLIQLPAGVALVTFTGFKRKARGAANLGGLVKLYIISEDDLTAEWPKLSDLATAGELTVVPPVGTGKTFVELVMDLDTGMMKSSRKGELGYHVHNHEGGAKFAGYDKTQALAVEKTLNAGGIVVGQTADGQRYVCGSTVKPCNFEYDANLGGKSDDKLQIDLSFKANGLQFGLVPLASSVTLPTS